jgi:CheY-like chemotaxis protein
MDQKLHGRSVLIAEREELIAMVIAQVFEEAGASVTACSNVADAVAMLGRGTFSAAVLDHTLFHGTDDLQEFEERALPYVLHNGLVEMHGSGADEIDVLPKPVGADALADAVARLLGRN